MIPENVVADGCKNIHQGDVIDVNAIVMLSEQGQATELSTPRGVVVVSQTCDVVQPSKKYVTVAPVIHAGKSEVSAAKKGRRPLYLYLCDQVFNTGEIVADLEKLSAMPKDKLVGCNLRARPVLQISSVEASKLAARIGRVFNRYPFPDEIPPIFSHFKDYLRGKVGKQSAVAKVFDYVVDIRVVIRWTKGYELEVTLIVADEYISADDTFDDGIRIGEAQVLGLKSHETLKDLRLDRVCELLVHNIENSAPDTVVSELWATMCDQLVAEKIDPYLNDQVADVEIVAKSDREFSYRDYLESESLDLETLSDSDS